MNDPVNHGCLASSSMFSIDFEQTLIAHLHNIEPILLAYAHA